MFGLFKRESELHPPSNAQAVACYKRGDFDGALRHVDALIAQMPQVALSHRFRGETLFAMNRFDEAIEAFNNAQKLGGPGTEEVFFWVALSHANSGRKEEAVTILGEYAASPIAQADLSKKCSAAIEAIKKSMGSPHA